jgi:hypothetical protein
MVRKSLSANIVARSSSSTRRPAEETARIAAKIVSELFTLQRWANIDPQTPYRREAAARIRALCDELERSQ